MRTRGQRRCDEQELGDDSRASLEEQNAALRLLNDGLERELARQRSSGPDRRRQLRAVEAALERKVNDVERLERQLREETSARREERLRADELQQRTDQDQTRLQREVEALEKRLEDQADINTSLGRLMPEMRCLMGVWERRNEGTSETIDLTEDTAEPATTRPTQSEQQTSSFHQERGLLLEQATDAATTMQDVCRRNLMEREAVLTCPISLELFESPVVTECCGKSFSSETLAQAGRHSSTCPFCRSHGVVAHPNRDVEKLVELHRAERQVLGLQEVAAPNPARDTPPDGAPATQDSRRRGSLGNISARRSQHREQRSQRVQIRSEVPYGRPFLRPSRPTDTPAAIGLDSSRRFSSRLRTGSSAAPTMLTMKPNTTWRTTTIIPSNAPSGMDLDLSPSRTSNASSARYDTLDEFLRAH